MTADKEKTLLGEMVKLYCAGHHQKAENGLCAACRAVLTYAENRSAHCPNRDKKTFCSACPTPCYKPEMREKIRAIMRYSGMRIIVRHPLLVIKHAAQGKRNTNFK